MRDEETRLLFQALSQILVNQDDIKKAECEEFSRCNTDWSGLQGGF